MLMGGCSGFAGELESLLTSKTVGCCSPSIIQWGHGVLVKLGMCNVIDLKIRDENLRLSTHVILCNPSLQLCSGYTPFVRFYRNMFLCTRSPVVRIRSFGDSDYLNYAVISLH